MKLWKNTIKSVTTEPLSLFVVKEEIFSERLYHGEDLNWKQIKIIGPRIGKHTFYQLAHSSNDFKNIQ